MIRAFACTGARGRVLLEVEGGYGGHSRALAERLQGM